MAGDLLGISVSGLNLSQTALRTAGHNIANANTEGYSRQSVYSTANTPIYLGTGFLGNGVEVTAVEREANSYVNQQLRSDTALFNQQESFLDNAVRLDDLLSNPALGLTDAMQRFFAALQSGADNPTSVASRQLILSEADGLVTRFNNLDEQMRTIEDGLTQQLSANVQTANALLVNIAKLNESISKAQSSTSSAPNDLLDKRDQTLLELSELISVKVTTLNDGQVNVAMDNGDVLVLGFNVNKLQLINSEYGVNRKEIALQGSNGFKTVSDQISGGKLGGLLSFRTQLLDKSFNELGKLAVTLSASFNTLHQQGIDLNGEFGQLLFSDVNSESAVRERVIHSPDNKPPYNRELTLDIVDSTALTGSDYLVEIEEGSQRFSITRLSDGVEVVSNLLTGRTPQNVAFDGLTLTFTGGQFQQGDSFFLQPTKPAAKAMELLIRDPEELAFAKPILAQNDIGNIGNGLIDFGDLQVLSNISGTNLPIFEVPGQMSPPLIVRFTSPTRYDVLDNSDPANPLQLDPPIRNQLFVPGQQNTLFGTDAGETKIVADGSRLGLVNGNALSSVLDPMTATVGNGYPAEGFYFDVAVDASRGAIDTYKVVIEMDSSARDIATEMSAVPGVDVTAWTVMDFTDLSNFSLDRLPTGELPQIVVNGIALLETEFDLASGTSILSPAIPNPASETDDFMAYLADQLSNAFKNTDTSATVITVDGNKVLRIKNDLGDDIKVATRAIQNASLSISDGVNPAITITNDSDPNFESIAVGGRFDIKMEEGVSVKALNPDSKLLGDTTAQDFVKSSFIGIQAVISGHPEKGDAFTIQYNNDAVSDNRNVLSMLDLELAGLLDGGRASISSSYGNLVELVGIETGVSKINVQASKGVMEQSQALRNSISGVNLDEEAANLIKFEQMYSANAQVISIARNIFDQLLQSF